MVDPHHARLSLVRQCRLVSIARSSFYYAGKGESPLNLRLMRLIDEQFLATPFYGSRQIDMDSSESPVHGQQEGSAYNGHFETVCYHPLFLFTDHGDCVAATLRRGHVSSADDWDELLVPETDRQQAQGKRVAVRADAAFARPADLRGAGGARCPVRDPDAGEQAPGARNRRPPVSFAGTAEPQAIGPAAHPLSSVHHGKQPATPE